MEVYGGHEITLIVGGYDRGIDYAKLAARLAGSTVRMVICLGVSGERICAALRAAGGRPEAARARSMAEAVALARQATSAGGVVLLSPAAPSYGYYRDFAERGRDFAAEAGLAGRRGEPPR